MESKDVYLKSEEFDVEKEEEKLNEFDYLRYTFVDLNGISRSKTIPKEHFKEFLKDGISLYMGASVFGTRGAILLSLKELVENNYGNCLVGPMPGTIHPLPWATEDDYKVGEVFCETFWTKQFRNGSHQDAGPRFLARKQLCRLLDLGYRLYSSFEAEFTVYQSDGKTFLFEGCDVFTNLLMAKYEKFLCDVDRQMRKCGVDIVALQTEYGPGGFEMALQPSFGITSADQMIILKDGIKAICLQRNWIATFMTKPDEAAMTSGLHHNHSLWSIEDGTNAFYDPLKRDEISDVMRHWIAGLLKHAPALTALCSPTVNCYRRLHQPWAAGASDWGIDNRLAMLRAKNLDAKATYIENRLVSSAANPYIVLAATVAAGMDGLMRKLECPEKREDGRTGEVLPMSLENALECLEKNDVMKEALGEEFVRWFTTLKRETEVEFLKKKSYECNVPDDELLKNEKELYFLFV